MANYRRNFRHGGSYFFTVNLAERRLTLLTDHIDLLRAAFRRVRTIAIPTPPRVHIDPGADVGVGQTSPDRRHSVWLTGLFKYGAFFGVLLLTRSARAHVRHFFLNAPAATSDNLGLSANPIGLRAAGSTARAPGTVLGQAEHRHLLLRRVRRRSYRHVALPRNEGRFQPADRRGDRQRDHRHRLLLRFVQRLRPEDGAVSGSPASATTWRITGSSGGMG